MKVMQCRKQKHQQWWHINNTTTRRTWNLVATIAIALTTATHAWTFPPNAIPTIGRRSHHYSCGVRSSSNNLRSLQAVAGSSPTIVDQATPLSLTIDELAKVMDGKGKAQACWDCFRLGVDPLWYYAAKGPDTSTDADTEPLDPILQEALQEALPGSGGWTRAEIQTLITPRRQSQGLGKSSLATYETAFPNSDTATGALGAGGDSMSSIAKVVQVHQSLDGTTKLLLELTKDKLQVECVIIPWADRQSSTLCVSNQVGCGQGCTFCSTGRMGELRSLTADEILVQVYWASKVCRLVPSLYDLEGIVFMGMGEAARNVKHVVRSAVILTDPQLFQLAQRRITISTVGPTPESFSGLGKAPAVLAWSVHASDDTVRKRLVPTTKHSMEELRDALIQVLLERPRKLRQVMLEFALIGGINDRPEDATHLVEFCQKFYQDVPAVKLVVNLIPWNDIQASSGPAAQYQKPAAASVQEFQNILVEQNILCYVRTTRGDDESAACGQLATKVKGLRTKAS